MTTFYWITFESDFVSNAYTDDWSSMCLFLAQRYDLLTHTSTEYQVNATVCEDEEDLFGVLIRYNISMDYENYIEVFKDVTGQRMIAITQSERTMFMGDTEAMVINEVSIIRSQLLTIRTYQKYGILIISSEQIVLFNQAVECIEWYLSLIYDLAMNDWYSVGKLKETYGVGYDGQDRTELVEMACVGGGIYDLVDIYYLLRPILLDINNELPFHDPIKKEGDDIERREYVLFRNLLLRKPINPTKLDCIYDQ